MSGVRPFGYGEMMRTGFVGNACGNAGEAAASATPATSERNSARAIHGFSPVRPPVFVRFLGLYGVQIHFEEIAAAEEVVDGARLVLDLPPVVVEVLEVEAVGAVALEHLVDLLDAVFVLQPVRLGVRPVHFLARGHVQAPVGEHVLVGNVLADAHGDHVHAGLQAQHHRGPRVAHHFEPEELLVEAPRLGEVLAHQRAVREQHRLDD